MSTNKQPEISLSGMPLPTLLLDAQQNLLAASPSFVAAFGDPSDRIGAPLDALFDPRDRRGVRGFHRTMSRHREGVLVAELRMKIVQSKPARLHMVEHEDGWLVSVVSTASEQAATESLQQARGGLRAILSSMSDGLLVLDINGMVQDCNQAALSIFRFASAHGVLLSSEAIVGRTLQELFDADVAARLTGLVATLSDDPDRVERLTIKRDERSLVVSLNPIFVPRRGYQGVCITARDLTEIETLHDRLSVEMALVRERTEALHRRNADMRRVLDNVQQGLLTVDIEGVIAPERSSVFDRWVGDCPAGTTLFEALARLNPDAAMMLELGWDQLSWGFLPVDLCLEQLPASIKNADRHFSLSYEPIFAEEEVLELSLIHI